MIKKLFITVTLVFLLASCGVNQFTSRLDQLYQGMSKKELIYVMGNDYYVASSQLTNIGLEEILTYQYTSSSLYCFYLENDRLIEYYKENTSYPLTYVPRPPMMGWGNRPGGNHRPPVNNKPDANQRPPINNNRPDGNTRPPANNRPDGNTRPPTTERPDKPSRPDVGTPTRPTTRPTPNSQGNTNAEVTRPASRN